MAIVGILAVVNMLFTTGVIRRLRQIESELGSRLDELPSVALPPGAIVEAARCRTLDGRELRPDDFSDAEWAFFSGSCSACERILPSYLASLEEPSSTTRITVLTSFDAATVDAMAGKLRVQGAQVVLEEFQGEAQSAFGVTGFPAFIRTEAGRISQSGYVPVTHQI